MTAAQLKKEMEMRGVSIRQLADMLDMSTMQIHRYLNGEVKIHKRTVLALEHPTELGVLIDEAVRELRE